MTLTIISKYSFNNQGPAISKGRLSLQRENAFAVYIMPYPISCINRATRANCEAAIDDKDKILGLLCQVQRPGLIIIICASAHPKLDVMISNVPSNFRVLTSS